MELQQGEVSIEFELRAKNRKWNGPQVSLWCNTWWRHQMEIFPCYWPFVQGIHQSPVNSLHKGQWHVSFDVFFDLCLNKRLSKQSWGWWFEMASCLLWRHCNEIQRIMQRSSPWSCYWSEQYVITCYDVLDVLVRAIWSPYFTAVKQSYPWYEFGNDINLTHWGQVTHIFGSDNGLSPNRRQAIIWTNAGLLLIGPLGTNFIEIIIKILAFSFKKMRLKVLSAKWRPFCLGLNVLRLQLYLPGAPLTDMD